MSRPLRIGEPVPSFEARDAEGRVWSDMSLRGRRYVLFFYPADETPGCIRESCAYRDLWPEFERLGILLLGVSRDDDASHRAFAQRRTLPYPLLSDPGGRMHQAFGAFMLGALPRRISYLVEPDGTVASFFDSHLRPEVHADRMLEAARSRVGTDSAPH